MRRPLESARVCNVPPPPSPLSHAPRVRTHRSFIYLIFGLTVVAGGFASFFTPEGKALVTPFYAAGALTIGFLIVALGVVGISAISAKQWFRQLLAIFMVFDLATLVACIVIATVFFKYEGMMQLASRSNIEVDLSPAYDEAMSAVKAVVQRTVTKCVPWAQPGSGAQLIPAPPPAPTPASRRCVTE